MDKMECVFCKISFSFKKKINKTDNTWCHHNTLKYYTMLLHKVPLNWESRIIAKGIRGEQVTCKKKIKGVTEINFVLANFKQQITINSWLIKLGKKNQTLQNEWAY